MTDVRERIAQRVARLLEKGWIVNLGVGLPTLVARYLDGSIFLHTENGMLGVGPPPGPGELDPNLIDASKKPITARPGASYFDGAASFAMIRGAHLDAAVLGALQVDARGVVANWAAPGRPVLGVGGAMDLLAGAGTVFAVMTHQTKTGEPKIVERCTLPITSLRPADWVVTELATFRREEGGLVLVEVAEGCSPDEVRARTGARFVSRVERRG